jgi:putative (di)nucleoside polyphosphate hydrolase
LSYTKTVFDAVIPPAAPILYRPNVAAILQREDGRILVAERINIAGAWQFPQGGVDDGETAEQALFRELQEEIGVRREHLEILSSRGGYRYAFAKGRLKYGIYGGQEQTYYLCRYTGTDADIDLKATHQEFASFRWIEPREFQLDWTPKFKRHVYRQVMQDFFGLELV